MKRRSFLCLPLIAATPLVPAAPHAAPALTTDIRITGSWLTVKQAREMFAQIEADAWRGTVLP